MKTQLKELIEEETKTPELSHGDSSPPEPPEPPEDDDDDEDDDDYTEDEIELEFFKEENRQLIRGNKLKLEVYRSETDRLELLLKLKEDFQTEPTFYNPRYTRLSVGDLNLSMNVTQARERCIISTYDAITRIIKKDIELEDAEQNQ